MGKFTAVEMAGVLAGEVAGPTTATGAWRGHRVTFRHVLRSEGSFSTWWTEIDVFALAAKDVWLRVRPMTPTGVHGVDGHLRTGDVAFDGAFTVEAAPIDVIGVLLDERMRARLLAWNPVSLLPIDGGLRLEKEGTLGPLENARRAVDLVTEVVVQIPEAFAEADRRAALESGVYRGDTAAVAARRKEEVERMVAAERTRREEVKKLTRAEVQKMARYLVAFVALLFAVALLGGILKRYCGVDLGDSSEPAP